NEVVSIIAKVELNAEQMRDLAFKLKGEFKSLFLVLASSKTGKALLTVMLTDDLVEKRNFHAGKIVSQLAKEIKGGGGGQANFATAGGSELKGIPSALEQARAILEE